MMCSFKNSCSHTLSVIDANAHCPDRQHASQRGIRRPIGPAVGSLWPFSVMQSPCNRELDTSTDELGNRRLGSKSVTFGVICETDGEYNGCVHVQVLL